MRTYHLDYSKNESYECGMQLVALLAYPAANVSEDTIGGLHVSLCNLYLKAKFDIESDQAIMAQPIKPIYAFREEKLIRRDLKQLQRRLRDRMVAARIAISFMQEAVLGDAFKLPKDVKRLSLNSMCTFVYEDANQADSENIESRVWRPSIPVVHLSTAIAVTIDQLETQGIGPVSIYHLVQSPDCVRKIITMAQEHADILLQSKRLKIKPEQLIHISCK